MEKLKSRLDDFLERRVPRLGESGYDDLPHALRKTLPEHLEWLGLHADRDCARRWLDRLESDPEGGATEAVVRQLLQGQVDLVLPGADPPDLRCRVGSSEFDVECTAILMKTTSKKTGLSPKPSGPSYYRPLNQAIGSKARKKATLVVSNPLLLIVGTFHFMGALASLDPLHMQRLVAGNDSAF